MPDVHKKSLNTEEEITLAKTTPKPIPLEELFPIPKQRISQQDLEIFTSRVSLESQILRKETKFKLYPLNKFENCIMDARTNAFRFLITTELKLFFTPHKNVEKKTHNARHLNITGVTKDEASCYTAGDLFIVDDKKLMINHKSGYFRPELDSLKLLLAFIVCNEEHYFSAYQEIIIEQLNTSGGLEQTHIIQTSGLKDWAEKTFEDELITFFKIQPEEIKEVVYQPTVSSTMRLNAKSFSCAKKLAFDEEALFTQISPSELNEASEEEPVQRSKTLASQHGFYSGNSPSKRLCTDQSRQNLPPVPVFR